MPIPEGELLACTLVWIAGAAMILLAVWMIISYKDRALRRRQRRYRRSYDATFGQTYNRRKAD